jgi:esterase/lipase superfamily enzyme
MARSHELIPSEHMGRSMHLWRYGHFGMPVLVFPSAAGFAHEWEAQGMLEVLADLVGSGRVKLYTTESNVAEAWTRKDNDPAWRIGRHIAFERYVVEELVPWIRQDCRHATIPIATTGCSLGAYYAANIALKHPDLFNWALCMSGRYELTHFTDGFVNSDVYFNSPLAYVPNLGGEALDRIREHTFLTMVCGQGAYEEGCIEETQELCDHFEAKGIPHQRDIWGHDVRHDWDWWRRQARFHFTRRFGG